MLYNSIHSTAVSACRTNRARKIPTHGHILRPPILLFQYLDVAQTMPDGVVLIVDVMLLYISIGYLQGSEEETYVAQMVEVVSEVT